MATERAQDKEFALPEGRLINGHLFVRSVYTDENGKEGAPMYKVEMAYPKKDNLLAEFEEHVWDILVEEYGQKTIEEADEEDLIDWRILDGDALKKGRESRGKEGDAYAGMDIIRASTQFNKEGDPAEGGIAVYDEDVEDIEPVNKSKVYNGSYGVVGVKCRPYTAKDRKGNTIYSVVVYIVAYQKTGDGDKLTPTADRSSLFEKKTTGKKSSGGRKSGRKARD
mgnify:CR=1 FL=1|tara:strand:- start:4602 stop:5273 length:672 start_codon:yes stop_codon:yes gene_type:complete